MKGKPKFKEGDKVRFWYWERFPDTSWDAELTEQNAKKIYKEGEIYIVDTYGTWDDPSDVSYDIMVYNDKHKVSVRYGDGEPHIEERTDDCLYKHNSERFVEAL